MKIVEQPVLLSLHLPLCSKVYGILSGKAQGVRPAVELGPGASSVPLQWLHIHGHLAVQHHHRTRDAVRNLFTLTQQVLQRQTHFT